MALAKAVNSDDGAVNDVIRGGAFTLRTLDIDVVAPRLSVAVAVMVWLPEVEEANVVL